MKSSQGLSIMERQVGMVGILKESGSGRIRVSSNSSPRKGYVPQHKPAVRFSDPPAEGKVDCGVQDRWPPIFTLI